MVTWTYFPITAGTLVSKNPFQEIMDKIQILSYSINDLNDFPYTNFFEQCDSAYNQYTYPSGYTQTKSTSFLGLDTYIQNERPNYNDVYPSIHCLRNKVEPFITYAYYYDEANDTFIQKTLAQILTEIKSTTAWMTGPVLMSAEALTEVQQVVDYLMTYAWWQRENYYNGLTTSSRSADISSGSGFDSWSAVRSDCAAFAQVQWERTDLSETQDEYYPPWYRGALHIGITSHPLKYRYWFDPEEMDYVERDNWEPYDAGRVKSWSCTCIKFTEGTNPYVQNADADFKIWWDASSLTASAHCGQVPVGIIWNGSTISSFSGYVLKDSTTDLSYSDFTWDVDNPQIITFDEDAFATYTPPIHLSDFPAWINTTDYIPGDCVTHAGNYYKCIASNTDKDPEDYYATYWIYAYDNGWGDCTFCYDPECSYPDTHMCDPGAYFWGTPQIKAIMVKPHYD